MKKVVKLLIISVLVLVCAMGLIACGDNSNAETDQGIVCRKFSGDNFYTVVGYKAVDGETELDISAAAQDKYQDKYGDTVIVGRIRKGAFDGNETLKKVIVSDKAGDGVDLTIDEGAFKNMRALESITLPFVGANKNSDAYYNESEPAENKAVDKERSFGYIFGEEENDNSSAMTFSYGDKSDMTATFYIPVALKEVTIKAETEINIPMYAFCGATRITTVKLQDKINAIGTAAFKNMTGLKTINIPASVKTIYDSAFEGATALTKLTFDEGSLLSEIKASAFKGTILTAMDISATKVETIGNYAFYGSSLKEFTFTTTIKSVGAYVFANSKKLATVNNKPSDDKLGVNAFADTIVGISAV